MPREIRDLMDERILQGRSSPALSDEEVHEVIRQSLALADGGGTEVSILLATEMFPVRYSDIEKGSNTIWRTDALPYDSRYGQSLAAPKPDAFFGYPRISESVWTEDENVIVQHPMAIPYIQPARGGKFPFLTFEIESEVTGEHCGLPRTGPHEVVPPALISILKKLANAWQKKSNAPLV